MDDHRSFAEAMSLALSAAPGFTCVGIATSSDQCLEMVSSLRPDVLLLDYQLLEGNGLQCLDELNEANIEVRTVMLTAHASPEIAARALEQGIERVLSKDAPLAMVLDAARAAAFNLPIDIEPPDRITFSERQRQVLDLMGEGFDPASIGERLFISVHTARGHVKDIMKLLGVSTQLAAVTKAQREGYLIPPRSLT
ncbi:MAG: response regulator transcription factor [Actinomycetota bacterium]